MKTKKKTYSLLVIVIGVWGYIGYQIIDALNPSIPEYKQAKPMFKDNYEYESKIDTFSIQKVARDPFLGTMHTPKSENRQEVQKAPKTVWKPIEYLGLIANKNDKDKVFIVSISKQQVLLKQGKTHDSIKLVRGDAKKITLRYKGKNKTFKLKS